MPDTITVYVNDRPVVLHRGTEVRHALIACDEALFDSAQKGRLTVVDARGFRVELTGGLTEGARLYTRKA